MTTSPSPEQTPVPSSEAPTIPTEAAEPAQPAQQTQPAQPAPSVVAAHPAAHSVGAPAYPAAHPVAAPADFAPAYPAPAYAAPGHPEVAHPAASHPASSHPAAATGTQPRSPWWRRAWVIPVGVGAGALLVFGGGFSAGLATGVLGSMTVQQAQVQPANIPGMSTDGGSTVPQPGMPEAEPFPDGSQGYSTPVRPGDRGSGGSTTIPGPQFETDGGGQELPGSPETTPRGDAGTTGPSTGSSS